MVVRSCWLAGVLQTEGAAVCGGGSSMGALVEANVLRGEVLRTTSGREAGRRGFTLIELLVVIAIIALLLSILLPSMQDARKQAQAAVCMSNSKQIIYGLQMYQQDHKGFMPPDLWSEAAWPSERPQYRRTYKFDLWFYALFPTYVGDEDVFVCPGDPIRGRFDFEAKAGSFVHRNARVPSCGYGMNYLLRHLHAHHNLASFNIERFPPTRPAETILLAEVGPDDDVRMVNTYNIGTSQPWRDGGRIIWDDGIRGWYNGPTWLTARHLGKINIASVDGAVKRVRTVHLLRQPLRSYYEDCAGETEDPDVFVCLLCNTRDAHYNFSHAKLWWWTGQIPEYADGYPY